MHVEQVGKPANGVEEMHLAFLRDHLCSAIAEISSLAISTELKCSTNGIRDAITEEANEIKNVLSVEEAVQCENPEEN
jgi:phosphosulfolactate phosphohydrolase-like enzyme